MSSSGRMRTLSVPPLLLEPLTVGHAEGMFAVLSDPAIYEFENAPPASLEALKRRYSALESRRSPDELETWLNWVIRLPNGELAGYVQATVLRSGVAYVAYELGSRHWRRGIGSAAVSAMLDELSTHYAVRLYVAVLKAVNFRSLGLLEKLGFHQEGAEQAKSYGTEADEVAMVKEVQHRDQSVT